MTSSDLSWIFKRLRSEVASGEGTSWCFALETCLKDLQLYILCNFLVIE